MKRKIMFLLLIFVGIVVSLGESAHAVPITPSTIFGIRDAYPEDGTPDHIWTTNNSSFIGQITGRGLGLYEEAFIEWDIIDQPIQQSAIVYLNLYYSDFDFGTGKRISISTYEGTGTPDISQFGTGSWLGEYFLPHIPNPGGYYTLSIDVTTLVNGYITDGLNYLGLRIHDPFFNVNDQPTQVALGNGSGMGSQLLNSSQANIPGPAPVPEPATIILLGTGLLGLVGASRKKFKK